METTQKPKVKLIGRDGNAFVIMGACRGAAQKAGWTSEQIEVMLAEMMSGDYDHLLRVAMDHFEVS